MMFKNSLRWTYKMVRRVVIGVIGTTVVLVGLVMFVTPGPALVVVPTGLAILSLEFAWARRWLRIARERAGEAYQNLNRSRHGGEPAEAGEESADSNKRKDEAL